jgi:N-ethylmaleimide reductase
MGAQTEAFLTEALFQPIKLGRIELANRMAMAPLTRSRADDDLVPTEMVVEYYRQRASVGLIIAEATQVSETAQGYTNTPASTRPSRSRPGRR